MIYKNSITEDYESFVENVCRDKELRACDKGLLFTLLCLPEGESFNSQRLSDATAESAITIRHSLKRLIDKGYAERRLVRKNGSYFERVDIEIFNPPRTAG